MTTSEQIKELAPFGFSARQARFLSIVMRHSGVCVQRQYAAFAGVVQGQKTRAFFARLERRGYATAYSCRRNRGRIYHLHHFGLYCAIGEAGSRYRRPVSVGRTPQRLTLLDALLADADTRWLATESELRNHLSSLGSASAGAVPTSIGRRSSMLAGPRSDTVRIGIDSTGRTISLYLAAAGSREDLRAFLWRSAPAVSRLPSWTLRLVFPRVVLPAYEDYQRVVREEWEMPFHAHTREELIRHFEHRRTVRQAASPDVAGCPERQPFAFDGPRFDRLYRRWLRGGAAALNDEAPQMISHALATGSGRIEAVTLNHAYEHLSPVVIGPEEVLITAANDHDTPARATSGPSA